MIDQQGDKAIQVLKDINTQLRNMMFIMFWLMIIIPLCFVGFLLTAIKFWAH